MIKYINDDPNKGIEYDWKFIIKEFNKLGVPNHVYTPINCPFDKSHLFVNLSDRSVGKTTNWLLLGHIMNKHYGTIMHYIRSKEDMITPKALKDLYSTINEYDYITKITDGKWNSVLYRARRWYYCNVDEFGEVQEVDEKHFMFCASVEKGELLKSSYNSPRGDFILFDEFIGKYYPPNEFVYFCDLVKTIIRDRVGPIIIYSANTIDKNSIYFNELEIFDQIQTMLQGDSRMITTDGGTNIYVEIVGQNIERQKKRSIVNKLFFGFKNPMLASITGADWAMKYYPHIPPQNETIHRDAEKVETLCQNIYIQFNTKYVRLDIVRNEKRGMCIYCHWSGEPLRYVKDGKKVPYEDSYIFTAGEVLDTRYHFKFGKLSAPLPKFIWSKYKENMFFYATNDVGAFIESYVKYCNNLV